ncbi:sterol desaturase family protein [Phenylobacterium sp.]|jgi:sterol desaturase/sphingolipid hydroxylase (fatty acid hydroxylase superfamily)|uniref:sterol desaturase family protein n=1 Tax=Phenylobacterium sp. TaxID=1871053 RepID=UPI002F40AA73
MHVTLSDIGEMWVHGVAHDARRYAIFAVVVWFTLWIVLARVLRPRKIREETPPARQLLIEFLFSLRSIAVFSTVGIGINLAEMAGLFPMSPMAASWGPAWFVASLAVMIVAQDAWIYWTHRWMHRPRWFRTFHRRHHRSNNPSPFTAYSFDLGEAFLMVIFVAVWPAIFPTPWGVINLFMFHQIFRNTMLHAGYELTPARADGRPWLDWITTTTHHDLHHAQAGYNFAPWFTWWDRWLGTEHPRYHAEYARAAGRALLPPGPTARSFWRSERGAGTQAESRRL